MLAWILFLAWAAPGAPPELEKARDAQDRAGLDRIAGQLSATAQQKPKDADAQYRYALAQSYVAEVAIEVKDNQKARDAAETGIKAAERAVGMNGSSAEFHRILGTLCGQVIPAAKLAGLTRGKCALDEVNKAMQLDPKSALIYVSRGVGNYYLPPAFGGGIDLAIKDFQKAIELDPRAADAYLWLGISLRKSGHNADARKAFQK